MLGKTMAWFMSTPNVPEIDKQKREAQALRDSRPDLSTLSDTQLVGRARSIQRHLVAMFAQHVAASLGASVGPGVLGAVTAEIDPTMVPKLLAGVGDIDSARIANDIWILSRNVRGSIPLSDLFNSGIDGIEGRISASADPSVIVFRAAVADFMFLHGGRGPNEWDVYSAVYETRPALLFSAVDRLRKNDDSADPVAGEARSAAERERVRAQLAAALEGNNEACAMLAAGLDSARVFMGARERCKTNNIRALHEVRMCFNELARRAVAAGHLSDPRHYFMLTEDELDPFMDDPRSFAATLAERLTDFEKLSELSPPYIVDGAASPLSAWDRRSDEASTPVAPGEILKGIAGSPGVVTGTAKVLLTIDDPTDLEPGDILIAPSTDPSWTPLFLAAAAVVVNVGAVGTHAVIVSRELGIPCVPSIVDATRRIPSGANITVDGGRGTVTVNSLP